MPKVEIVILLVIAFGGMIAAAVLPPYLMNRARKIK